MFLAVLPTISTIKATSTLVTEAPTTIKMTTIKTTSTLATETPTTMKITTITTTSTLTTETPTTMKVPITTPEIMAQKGEEIVTESTEKLSDGVKEYTDDGVECKTKCEKQGEMYYWCWQVTGSWDYCVPGKY